MQKTNIFTSLVGGSSLAKNVQIATTTAREQVEIIATKRTNGRVRITINEAAAPTSGVELPLDEPFLFRLGENQRCFITSDETVNAQSVDIVVQPPTNAQPASDALNAIANDIATYTGSTPANNPYCPPKSYK